MTAIGCTAFPLALQMIDVELHPKTSQKQQHVDNLVKQMKSYKNKYYITDWVMRAIRHVVELARQRDDPGASSALDMLKSRPSYYLRLVMTLDMSISNGRLPDECDFPPSLRAGRGTFAKSQSDAAQMGDEESRKRFSAMNKDLIPDNMTEENGICSTDLRDQAQAQDAIMVDQESFFNTKQPFPVDLTAALCEITNIPPLDFSDMPLLDSSLFNETGGVPFWPYELLGSPPDNLGQVEDIMMGDIFAGMMGNASQDSSVIQEIRQNGDSVSPSIERL
ncbi:hypothetical protein NW768_011224 [Fusarium equiseti]|uniref:Uncharacterized protein n=1 Tax=Fusarium equiseti TaxID=61235 RepID=A0ABQ8QXS0_FUSEQ|nr:hypothetical protein NW768_011224 [Fusarium equiseti]